jgi:hypothetical protein
MRIWGTGDFRHWFNLDVSRPRKHVALVLDVGGWVRPVITPDRPDEVQRLVQAHSGVAASAQPHMHRGAERLMGALVMGSLVFLTALLLLDGMFPFSTKRAMVSLIPAAAATAWLLRAGGSGPVPRTRPKD